MFDRMNDRVTAVVTILLAVGAALLTWLVFALFGVEPTVTNGGDEQAVGAIDIIIATVVAGLAAWVVRLWLVRAGHSRWWPFVGTTAMSISMLGPTYLSDGASIAALSCMHFAVGIVLILGLARVGVTYARSCV